MKQTNQINFSIPIIGVIILLILSLSSFTIPKDGQKRYYKGTKQEYDGTHKRWVSSYYDYQK